MNGMMKYLTDLGLSPDHITVLVLSELVQSPTLGEITRQGFTTGWAAHGSSATSVSGQKTILSRLTQQLSTTEARAANGLFRKVYKYTFKIALPAGTRGVPLDAASEYWKLLFGSSGANWTQSSSDLTKPWLDWYLSFLNDKWKKAVNRDLWDQTLVFEEKTRSGEGLEWWSEDGAWPGVIDEFVSWCKTEKGVGGGLGDAMKE
jgi:DCN1-like protein 1/2